MQYLDLIKCHLVFNKICSAVHTLLSSVVQCLDFSGVEVLLTLKKVVHSGNGIIISLIVVSIQMFFHVREQKIIR